MDIAAIAKETIPQATANNKRFVTDGDTEDIIAAIKCSIPVSVEQTKDFAKALKKEYAENTKALLEDLYEYVVNNIRLKIDPIGKQDIRRPSNLVHGEGVADCKSYSLFFAGILTNLGIPFRFKFVSWQEWDKNVKHVYIVANAGGEIVCLDANKKQFNSEQKPYYNARYLRSNTINTTGIDMTKISYIGDTKTPKKGLLNGRSLDKIGTAELNLRAKRNKLRAERNKIANSRGIGNTRDAIKTYNAAISYTDDLINAVAYITKNNTNDQTSAAILSPIIEDWENGEYLKHSRQELNERRKNRKHEIGKNIFKKLGSTLKSFCKKTLNGTKNILGGATKLLGNITRLATVAPFAVLTKEGRKGITEIAQNIASNAKQFGSGFVDINRALPSAICETALEKRLPACAWAFLYLAISEDENNVKKWVMRSDCEGYTKGTFVNIPSIVLEKRKKAANIKKKFTKYIGVDSGAFDDIIAAAILDQTGYTQEKCIDLILSGNGSCISIAKEVANTGSLLSLGETQQQHEQNLIKLIQGCEDSIEKVAAGASLNPDSFTDASSRKYIYECQTTSIYFNYLRQLYAVMLQLLYVNYDEYKAQIVTGQTNPNTMTDYNAFVYWLNRQWTEVQNIIPDMAKFDANCLNLYTKNYPLYAEKYEKHMSNIQNFTLDISVENNDADLSTIDTNEVGEGVAALITAIVGAISAIVGVILKCCGKEDASSIAADCSNVASALASSEDGAANKIQAVNTALSNSSNEKVSTTAATAQNLTNAVQQATEKASGIKDDLYNTTANVTTYITTAADTLEKANSEKTIANASDTLEKIVETVSTPSVEETNNSNTKEQKAEEIGINKWWLLLGGVGIATALLVKNKKSKKKHQ